MKRAIFEGNVVQKDLAARIEMDPARLSNIVNGLHAEPETRAKIVKGLHEFGVDVAEPDLWPDLAEAA